MPLGNALYLPRAWLIRLDPFCTESVMTRTGRASPVATCMDQTEIFPFWQLFEYDPTQWFMARPSVINSRVLVNSFVQFAEWQ